jgi:cytochrome c oxidase assembly protein subunit 11
MTTHTLEARNRKVGLFVLLGAFTMLGASYAAVPLYDLFCRMTGFGGTTQKAEKAPDKVLAKTIRVRFDANVSGLPWRFRPNQNLITVKIGETALVSYTAQNLSNQPTTGTATFNVSPDVTGAYFNKLQCFCFTEQTLKPGETIQMPVTIFVDPDIVNDSTAKGVPEITLSYTFFPVKSPKTLPAATIKPVALISRPQ